MKYKLLGKSGLRVSELCLGTMTFGEDWGWGASKDESRAVFETFTAAGGNFIDTANLYTNGSSGTITGELIKGDRDRYVLATKFSLPDNPASPANAGNPNAAGNQRKNLMRSVEGSLKRLGTDYVDLYSPHCPDAFTPLEETLEALDTLVRQGKTRYLGCSNWPAWMTAKAIQMQKDRGWARFISAQLYYSLLGRDIELETVPMLRDAGAGLMAWSPLSGGFLSGKYTWDNLKDADNRLSGFDVLQFDKAWGFEVVEGLREIGKRHGASPAQTALAWVLAQPHATTILLGASKPSQLDDNLGSLKLTLTPDDLAALNTLAAPRPLFLNWVAMTADDQTATALGS